MLPGRRERALRHLESGPMRERGRQLWIQPIREAGPLQSGRGLRPLVASGHPAFISQSARPRTGDTWI